MTGLRFAGRTRNLPRAVHLWRQYPTNRDLLMKTPPVSFDFSEASIRDFAAHPQESLKQMNQQLHTSLTQLMSKLRLENAKHTGPGGTHGGNGTHGKHVSRHAHAKHPANHGHSSHSTNPSHPHSTQHLTQRSEVSSGKVDGSTGPTSRATSVDQAAGSTHPQFKPVIRGDEKQSDAQVKNQADFGRLVDRTAREYGLDPNMLRAQLQVESGAFTSGYQSGMRHVGDLDRAPQNNTSLGLGQISQNYLDGGPWSKGGPGDPRLGGQVVTKSEYENSVTIQVRMAAANDALRIADHGGLKQGLSYYVSGNADPSNPSGASYLQKINEAMQNPAVTTPGR